MGLDDPPQSWRLDVGGSDLCTIALFVRDAAGLDVPGPPTARIPPLIGVTAVPTAEREVAARQWPVWWQQVLEVEVADRSTPAPQVGRARQRLQYRIARREAVCDPPEFTALADRPELRAAARVVVAGHRGWARTADPGHVEQGGPDAPPGSVHDWSVVKQAAEDVAFDHRVGIERVRGRIVVLPVVGVWWSCVAPGTVLCSPAGAEDPITAQVLLRAAFTSGLAR